MKGQNVRLAARLCGWKIDIRSHTQFEESGGIDGIGMDYEITGFEENDQDGIAESEGQSFDDDYEDLSAGEYDDIDSDEAFEDAEIVYYVEDGDDE